MAAGGAGGSEYAWLHGAEGEELVARVVAQQCPAVWALHDRRRLDTSANIDHIFVAPSGIYVVDTKRYKGLVTIERSQPENPRLLIAGRDQTKLVDGLDRQVTLVRELGAEAHMSQVPIYGSFCFVEGLLRVRGGETIRGYPLAREGELVARLNAAGPLTDDRIRAVVERLDRRLPAA